MSFKLLKEMMDGEFAFDTSMNQGDAGSEEENPAANIFSTQTQDHPDTVAMDVPTLIRVMEWAHEDCKDDVMLHQFANALILASFRHSPLDIEDYQDIIDAVAEELGNGNVPDKPDVSEPQDAVVFQN